MVSKALEGRLHPYEHASAILELTLGVECHDVGKSLCGLLDEAHFLPDEAGLLVADRYDAAVHREAVLRPLSPARRKAEWLNFARRAARRLSAQIDPTLGFGS